MDPKTCGACHMVLARKGGIGRMVIDHYFTKWSPEKSKLAGEAFISFILVIVFKVKYGADVVFRGRLR